MRPWLHLVSLVDVEKCPKFRENFFPTIPPLTSKYDVDNQVICMASFIRWLIFYHLHCTPQTMISGVSPRAGGLFSERSRVLSQFSGESCARLGSPSLFRASLSHRGLHRVRLSKGADSVRGCLGECGPITDCTSTGFFDPGWLSGCSLWPCSL